MSPSRTENPPPPLGRSHAGTPAARTLRKEKNLVTSVTKILKGGFDERASKRRAP
jgi:hypothetical protein